MAQQSNPKLTDAEKIRQLALALLWRCVDCGNVYTREVESCNNPTLDYFVMQGIITKTHIQEAQ